MRVVADSHAVVWYLLDNDRKLLSPKALAALGEAEADGGIAVSVVSLIDLWYVTRRREPSARPRWKPYEDCLQIPTRRSTPCRSA